MLPLTLHPFMSRADDDEIVDVDFAQQVLMDGLDASRRPDAHALMLLDMSAAHAFRQRYEDEQGIALTDLHLIIKAVARTLEPGSPLNSIVHGYRIIRPRSIDIGVSVATQRSVTPVVVIPEAHLKPLPQIAAELTQKAREAAEKERARFARINRAGRWIPSHYARRQLTRFLLRRHQVRRAMVGTVQITSLGLKDVAFYLPNHMATTMLISVGGVVRRPVVVDDRIEIRPTAYIAFQVDQRVVNAVNALKVFRRFRRFMEQPEKLVE